MHKPLVMETILLKENPKPEVKDVIKRDDKNMEFEIL